MQDDEFISDEESEWRANQEVEELINGPKIQDDEFLSPEEEEFNFEKQMEYLNNCPGYMHTSWEDFILNPKIIEAKRLWLQFTEKGEAIPGDVTAVLIKAFKNEIDDYETYHSNANKQIAKIAEENQLFMLLHTAKTDIDSFWKLLQGVSSSIFSGVDNRDNLLEILRKWLPVRRGFKPGELYSLFDELDQKKNSPPSALPFLPKVPRESFVCRYKRWKNQNMRPCNK